MRLISINVVKAGMIVGRTIWNEAGHPLLQKGVVLTDRILFRLKQLHIKYVYIEDKISYGIEIEETIQPEVRNKIVNKITKSFHSVKEVKSGQASFILEQQSKEIGAIVEDLLTTILDSEEVLTVLTDAYVYDEYLYQHSFQVTLYSLAIAKEMGYSSEDLRLIGIGAMLHDIGKLLIPTDILLKPERLTNEEYEIMKTHTTLGYEMCMKDLALRPYAIGAWCHHECLNGTGYPRGLTKKDIPYEAVIREELERCALEINSVDASMQAIRDLLKK